MFLLNHSLEASQEDFGYDITEPVCVPRMRLIEAGQWLLRALWPPSITWVGEPGVFPGLTFAVYHCPSWTGPPFRGLGRLVEVDSLRI